MQALLKDILLEKINDDVIYTMGDYLKRYNQPDSYFNYDEFYKLKLVLMHKYHNHKNLCSLNPQKFNMLHQISCCLSLEQFEEEIDKLGSITTDNGMSLEQRVHNAFGNKVLHLGGWFKIYADEIKGTTVSDITHRIYLAVDNSCLHKFALSLVNECGLFHVQYRFKINNGDLENQYDNVVIYANKEELPAYIHCIEKVLNKNPEIKFNQKYLIAYPYDKNIAVAPYLDTNNESYSQIVSEMISDCRDDANSREDFILKVDRCLNGVLDSTKTLCDKIKLNRMITKNVLANENAKRR